MIRESWPLTDREVEKRVGKIWYLENESGILHLGNLSELAMVE